jgi:hypothetical protein
MRVGGENKLTIAEANDIFGFLVDDLEGRITNSNRTWYNPDYKFSIEKLDLITNNLKEIFEKLKYFRSFKI